MGTDGALKELKQRKRMALIFFWFSFSVDE
jgi:hypothetical protein